MILIPDLPTSCGSRQRRRGGSSPATQVSRRLPGRRGVPLGEVTFPSEKATGRGDFVVLWRGVVIVVEVKGGGVRKREGTWYSVNRHGDWHKLERIADGAIPLRYVRAAGHPGEDGIGWFAKECDRHHARHRPPPPRSNGSRLTGCPGRT